MDDCRPQGSSYGVEQFCIGALAVSALLEPCIPPWAGNHSFARCGMELPGAWLSPSLCRIRAFIKTFLLLLKNPLFYFPDSSNCSSLLTKTVQIHFVCYFSWREKQSKKRRGLQKGSYPSLIRVCAENKVRNTVLTLLCWGQEPSFYTMCNKWNKDRILT